MNLAKTGSYLIEEPAPRRQILFELRFFLRASREDKNRKQGCGQRGTGGLSVRLRRWPNARSLVNVFLPSRDRRGCGRMPSSS